VSRRFESIITIMVGISLATGRMSTTRPRTWRFGNTPCHALPGYRLKSDLRAHAWTLPRIRPEPKVKKSSRPADVDSLRRVRASNCCHLPLNEIEEDLPDSRFPGKTAACIWHRFGACS
jgi:hypothetical protein